MEKAEEKHPSEDVVPAELMVAEPDGALILGQGRLLEAGKIKSDFFPEKHPKELRFIPAVQQALIGLGPLYLSISDVEVYDGMVQHACL